MELEETTAKRNAEPEMESYYLHRLESPSRRWGLAVEQLRDDHFSVAVTFTEPNWPVHGVARHWSYSTRDVAEAQYLVLQNILADIEESANLSDVTRKLPPPERISTSPEEEPVGDEV
ncbi:MAG: hypothetical protein VKN33_10895 [Candidatus Sericytochromatia bacterium]|nr:hypothetical protein [Candidatus Sericytochromatia bacterium]